MPTRTRKLPNKEEIDFWMSYNEATGEFTWVREPRPARPLLGKMAGCRTQRGYWKIHIRGHFQVPVQTLAWIVSKGTIPDGIEVDHADGDPSNNRLSNLRLATSSEQKYNKRVQSNNRSGLKGAYFHACHKGKKWRSQIRTGRGLVFLGYFHTAREAHEAYASAATKYHGEFARAL